MLFKTCTRCGDRKSRDEFYAKANAKDGRQYWCKTCVADYRRVQPRPQDDWVHTDCGGVLIDYNRLMGRDYLVRCEKCRLVGVPV